VSLRYLLQRVRWVALACLIACSSSDSSRPADAGAIDPNTEDGSTREDTGSDVRADSDASSDEPDGGGGSNPADAATGADGGGAGNPADAASGADGGGYLPLGPPVVVLPGTPSRLFFHGGEGRICLLDSKGDVACRITGNPVWMPMQKGPFASVVDGGDFGCGLNAAGALRCWQMDPNRPYKLCSNLTPTDCLQDGAPPLGKYRALSAGTGFACVIEDAGSIRCWGNNEDGRATPPAANDFVSISSGGVLSCAIRSAGTLDCWGDLFSIDIRDLPTPVVQVVSRGVDLCVLTQGGGLECAGWSAAFKQRVPAGFVPARITSSGDGICGLSKTGVIKCWATVYAERYAPPPGPYVDAVVGTSNVCALRGDDVVECWGDDWGNGAGDEQCKVTEAEATTHGKTQTFYVGEKPWGTFSTSPSGTWAGVTTLELDEPVSNDASSFVYFAAEGGKSGIHSSPKETLDDGQKAEIKQSVWALSASATAPGEILCSATGSGSSIARNGDELTFDVRKLASLGSCPGKPVSGQLSWCNPPTCLTGAASGSIGGVDWTALGYGISILNKNGGLSFDDGSYLRIAQGAANVTERWGLLITAANSPFGGQIFCVGEMTGTDTNMIFSQLSTLGACPTNGSGSLDSCVR
jgi:hypothetical protein